MSDNLNRRRVRFTEIDVMLASSVNPLHHRKIKATVDSLRATVEHLIYGRTAAERFHWAEIADAANLIEALLDLRHIDDPEGLHRDTHQAMVEAGQRVMCGKVGQLRLDAKGAAAMLEFVDGYESILRELPARKVIRGFVLVEERLQRFMAGEKQPGVMLVEV